LKLAFYAPDGAGDKQIVAAVMAGAARHGDEVVYIPTYRYDGVTADADAAACYGVRASTRIILDAWRRAGKQTLFFDKGYWGRGLYTRVAVNAWQPTAYFRRGRDGGRLAKSGLAIRPGRDTKRPGRTIYAATTQTWCDFYDLGPSRALDEVIVAALAGLLGGGVVYRPRPAYAKKHPELCLPIAGSALSDPEVPLAEALKECGLLVTLGSNAAVEALAAGVPVLVLGDNPCAMMNMTLSDREPFFNDLAWCQWTLDEYLSGEAWAEIKAALRTE
jgi:putative glycosyltransferase DUF6716